MITFHISCVCCALKENFCDIFVIHCADQKNSLQCFDAVGWAAGLSSGAGVVVCLEQGADLHMAQLMPLPLTVSCFSKIQIGFTNWLTWVVPDKGPLNGCGCVCAR